MSEKEKLELIPKAVYEQIELPLEFTSRKKPNLLLTKVEDETIDHWTCDIWENKEICLNGLAIPGKSAGIPFWLNKEADWGPCGECAQADKIIEMIENKEEKLLYEMV